MTFIYITYTYKEGYNFIGWFTSATGGDRVTAITAGTSAHVVVYAK